MEPLDDGLGAGLLTGRNGWDERPSPPPSWGVAVVVGVVLWCCVVCCVVLLGCGIVVADRSDSDPGGDNSSGGGKIKGGVGTPSGLRKGWGLVPRSPPGCMTTPQNKGARMFSVLRETPVSPPNQLSTVPVQPTHFAGPAGT